MTQLRQLAEPFKGRLVKQAPQGKHGTYVGHSTVTERLLSIVGPFDFHVTELIRGHAPEVNGKNQTWPARDGAVVGVLAIMRCDIDGRFTEVTEVGTEDQPAMGTDAENAKNAASDALKRCAMRLGLGLHLWSQQDYFLDKQLDHDAADKVERGGGQDARDTVIGSGSSRGGGEPDSGEADTDTPTQGGLLDEEPPA